MNSPRIMEAHHYLEMRLGMIEPETDFTRRWCVNMGLPLNDSVRMSLAVDEILNDILLHAYKEQQGYVEIWYQYSLSGIEIVIQEMGEPFDPQRHSFSVEKALNEGDFEGAGLEVARRMVDHFLFLNRGKGGKEFRLVSQLDFSHVKEEAQNEVIDVVTGVRAGEEPSDESETEYRLYSVTSSDAEDISRLIYKTYGYSYSKEDLYFPRRIELAVRHGYKFGTIARTKNGFPVGYFAVIRNSDSPIGEIGEAVVSPEHRKKGLMKKMLDQLIEMSRRRGLMGIYGMALTVHTISQKVNETFGFRSTALMLAKSPPSVYKGIREDYPQPVSLLLDFLPLTGQWDRPVWLPNRYEPIIIDLYNQFDNHPVFVSLPEQIEKDRSDTRMHLDIQYESNTALIVVERYGDSFETSSLQMFRSIAELNLTSVYIDIPLDHPWAEHAVEWLKKKRFLFAGLMPMFHGERDYLRMQSIEADLDFGQIETLTSIAGKLKKLIKKEYDEIREKETVTTGRTGR